VKAAERMAHARVGALIVLERDADLTDYLNEAGEEIEAKVKAAMATPREIADQAEKAAAQN